ncbi:unnamed protein product, partial [Ectocarpus sp. 12 AP-2014]
HIKEHTVPCLLTRRPRFPLPTTAIFSLLCCPSCPSRRTEYHDLPRSVIEHLYAQTDGLRFVRGSRDRLRYFCSDFDDLRVDYARRNGVLPASLCFEPDRHICRGIWWAILLGWISDSETIALMEIG